MAKVILSVLMLLGGGATVCAQGKWGIRVNQNTDIFSVMYMGTSKSYSKSITRFARVSVAGTYITENFTHDLELFIPEINSSSPQFPWEHSLYDRPERKNRMTTYSLRYMLSRNMAITKSFSLTLGGAINPYFLKDEYVPQDETVYFTSNSVFGVSLNIVPGVSLKASKRLSFVLDCPFKLFDVYRLTYDVQNPAIPVRQQKMSSVKTDFFMNAYTFRLGAAFRLGN